MINISRKEKQSGNNSFIKEDGNIKLNICQKFTWKALT